EETTRWLQEFLSAGQQAVDPQLAEGVGRIIRQVAQDGDEALRALARQFGEEPPETFRLPDEALDAAIARLPREAKALLERAAENIRFFAEGVARLMQPVRLERPGYALGMDFRPVDRVACYVPGGRYPLPSTALMTAVTARAAGVPQVCIFSPKL